MIIIGGVFSILGYYICKFYKWRSVKGYPFLLIGLILLYLALLGPSSHNRKHIEAITNIDSNKVKSIAFHPTRKSGNGFISLVKSDTLITEKKVINNICLALAKASMEGEGFGKNATSGCWVEISLYDNSTIVFGVKRIRSVTCLSLNSGGEDGWHYANLDGNSFGFWLDAIIK